MVKPENSEIGLLQLPLDLEHTVGEEVGGMDHKPSIEENLLKGYSIQYIQIAEVFRKVGPLSAAT